MENEVTYKPVIEKILSDFYPGIKLHRTFDLYADQFVPYDYESDLLPDQKKRVFVELKTIKTDCWGYDDNVEGIDLLTIHEGRALRALCAINPHFDCFLFVIYIPKKQVCYTRIDRLTPMVKRPNHWLGKQMYWIPKESFNCVLLEQTLP